MRPTMKFNKTILTGILLVVLGGLCFGCIEPVEPLIGPESPIVDATGQGLSDWTGSPVLHSRVLRGDQFYCGQKPTILGDLLFQNVMPNSGSPYALEGIFSMVMSEVDLANSVDTVSHAGYPNYRSLRASPLGKCVYAISEVIQVLNQNIETSVFKTRDELNFNLTASEDGRYWMSIDRPNHSTVQVGGFDPVLSKTIHPFQYTIHPDCRSVSGRQLVFEIVNDQEYIVGQTGHYDCLIDGSPSFVFRYNLTTHLLKWIRN